MSSAYISTNYLPIGLQRQIEWLILKYGAEAGNITDLLARVKECAEATITQITDTLNEMPEAHNFDSVFASVVTNSYSLSTKAHLTTVKTKGLSARVLAFLKKPPTAQAAFLTLRSNLIAERTLAAEQLPLESWSAFTTTPYSYTSSIDQSPDTVIQWLSDMITTSDNAQLLDLLEALNTIDFFEQHWDLYRTLVVANYQNPLGEALLRYVPQQNIAELSDIAKFLGKEPLANVLSPGRMQFILNSPRIASIDYPQLFLLASAEQSSSPLDFVPLLRYNTRLTKLIELHLENTEDPSENWSLLHTAARHNRCDEINLLAEWGFDINAQTVNGYTPLYRAAAYGKIEAMNSLIALGADISITNNTGQQPLHIAASNSKIKVMEKLKNLGADVDARDDNNQTPVHLAAARGRTKAVKKLHTLEATIDLRDDNNQTALHIAARRGRIRTIQQLKALGADLEARDDNGFTPLHVAAANDQVAAMQKLRKLGANIHAGDHKGRTPLHLAAGYGQTEALEKLIDMKTPVDVEDEDGRTPLHIAVINGRIEAAKILVDRQADIEKQDHQGLTSLRIVVNAIHEAREVPESTHLENMNTLVTLGANVNSADSNGHTALHAAATYGQIKTMRTLKSLEADLEARDHQGRTPFHVAAASGQVAAMQELKALGANINATDNQGLTPLHIAAEYGQTAAIKKLVALGASLELPSKNGETPLYHAALQGEPASFAALVAAGASCSTTTPDKRTLAHAACIGGSREIVEQTYHMEEVTWDCDQDGFSPLMRALEALNLRVVRFLSEKGMTLADIPNSDPTSKHGRMLTRIKTYWELTQEGTKALELTNLAFYAPSPLSQGIDLLAALSEVTSSSDEDWSGLTKLIDAVNTKKHEGIVSVPKEPKEKSRFYQRIEAFLEEIFAYTGDGKAFMLRRLNDIGNTCGEGWFHGIRQVWAEIAYKTVPEDETFNSRLETCLRTAFQDAALEEAMRLIKAERAILLLEAHEYRRRLLEFWVQQLTGDKHRVDAHDFGIFARLLGGNFHLAGYSEQDLTKDPAGSDRTLANKVADQLDAITGDFSTTYSPTALLWVAQERLLEGVDLSADTGWGMWNKAQTHYEGRSLETGVLTSYALVQYLQFLGFIKKTGQDIQ